MASRLAQLFNAARALPGTPFRSSGPQLSDAIENMASRGFNVPAKSEVRALEAKTVAAYEDERLGKALDSLARIREGAAMREFPLTQALVHPQHDPHYYNRMRDGVHRSAQGIGRSWWKRFFQVRGRN